MFHRKLKTLRDLGKIQEIEHTGTWAEVYLLPNGNILKYFQDHGQSDFLKLFQNKGPHFPVVYSLTEWTGDYCVVMERLECITQYLPNYNSFIHQLRTDMCRNIRASDYSIWLGNQTITFRYALDLLITEGEHLGAFPDITPENIMVRSSDKSIVFLDPWG